MNTSNPTTTSPMTPTDQALALVVSALKDAFELGRYDRCGINARAKAEDLLAKLAALPSDKGEAVYVIFDGPPSHESGRFVEVETATGKSVGPKLSGAHWDQRPDKLWRLGPFYAHPARPDSGWVCVPREPTHEMLVAGVKALHINDGEPWYAYKAMLAAAPQPNAEWVGNG